MPKITITGLDARVNGGYDLDLEEPFDGNELHLIKKVAGVRVGEIGDAMAALDYDLVICLAKIALDRNGRSDVSVDMLMGAKVGQILLDKTDAEKAADKAEEEELATLPPANAPTGATAGESERTHSGGSSSNGSDDLPATVLPGIGGRD